MPKKTVIFSILGIIILMLFLSQKQEPVEVYDINICEKPIGIQTESKPESISKIPKQETSEDNSIWKIEDLNAQEVKKATTLPSRRSVPEIYGFLTNDNNIFSENILSGYYLNNNINAAIAAKSIKDYIIQPGEVFSFNDATGPRTKEKGYVEGVSVSGDQYIIELAGGICRTSTALYNSALNAGFPIIESHRHTMPIYYADKGRDAAVYYGQIDMKFQNNRDMPIKILLHINNGRIYIALQELRPEHDLIIMEAIEETSIEEISSMDTIEEISSMY